MPGDRGSKSKHVVSVEREVDVPARLAFRSWAENTLLHPDQVRKRVGQRLVEFKWQGTEAPDSVVEMQFLPKNVHSCLLKVRHSEIADEAVARKLEERWRDELEALAAHALQRQDVPTLEIQVLPDRQRPPSDKN